MSSLFFAISKTNIAFADFLRSRITAATKTGLAIAVAALTVMLLLGGGEARAALSCGGPAYGTDKFYAPPANCDATSAGTDGFVLNQTQSGSPGNWIVNLNLNNPTGSQRTFTCTSTTNGCGGGPGYSNPSFFGSISAACSTGTGDCTMTYTYTNSTGLVTVTYYIPATTNYILTTSISGGGFDGPSTSMLLGSSKSPSNSGDAVTLTARLTGYGALGIGGGNVDLSSNLGGALGSAALDTLGGTSAIAGGVYHTCAVTSAGGVKCWGLNSAGQLGDGTNINRSTPVDVVGLSSGVVAVTSGGFHSCALTSSGGVKCWGYGQYGQIGDGGVSDRLTPVNVSGLTSGVVAISAGYYSTCALLGTGEIKCWGYNVWGQLGDGTTTNRSTPVSVRSGGVALSGAVAISASYGHTCALLNTGGVKCWGLNGSGGLGDGTTTNRSTPGDVSGLTSGVVAITTLIESTCALTSGGGVKCWGYNGSGQLGDGSTTNRPTPVDVSGLTSGTTAISGGHSFTCALTSANGAKCWGSNGSGQLGDGTTTNRTAPVGVSTLSSGAGAWSITTGEAHTCAVVGGATVKCWGNNTYGQVGDGTTNNRATPTSTPGIATALMGKATLTTSSLARGFHTITASYDGDGAGSVFAPANATVAQQVFGSTMTTAATSKTPATSGDSLTFTARVTAYGGGVPTGNVNFSSSLNGAMGSAALDVYGGTGSIATGDRHTCVLTSSGGVSCWGWNRYGQLGNVVNTGSDTANPTPTAVAGLSGVVALAASNYHTCALKSDGTVSCWGRNDYGQLGNATGTGTITAYPTPTVVAGLSGVVALAAGLSHTCALTSAGTVSCWGYNYYGQLGNTGGTGLVNPHPTPTTIVGLSGVAAVVAGNYHTCALMSSGTVSCWGRNNYGQLGNVTGSGTENATSAPTEVSGLSGVTALAAGFHHTCALTSPDTVSCWGWNRYGQLGNATGTGSNNAYPTPAAVTGLSGVVALAAAFEHSCALTSAGGASCWGANINGELGNATGTGTNTAYPTPAVVAGLSGGVALAAGFGHNCVLTSSWSVSCWGANGFGQLGNATGAGTGNPYPTPATVAGVSPAINAKATLSISSSGLSLGAHTITTAYVGDANHEASNAGVTQQLDAPPVPTITALSPAAGPVAGGTSVVITGTNLSGATSVTFGGDSAGFTVDSATQITATAPPHAGGTVDVIVTTPSGASATGASSQYAYVAAPTVTALSPNAGPLGGGTTVVVSGTNFTNATGVTFGGGSALSYSVVSDTQISALSPSGAGTVDVRVATAGGTSVISAADQFTYVPAPTVTGVSPGSGPVLGGASVTITGTNLSGATAVTFGGVAATSVTVVSVTQITATTPAHAAGSVDVAVTTSGGTITSSGAFTYQLSPTALLVGTAKTPTYLGQTATFTARVTGLGGGAPTGNVNFSSNVSGAIGPAALDAVGTPGGLAPGDAHTCFLTEAGGVKCSGDNSFGELGDGTTTNRLSPVDVVGLSSGVVAIASGLYHTCALTDAGGVKCWGYNDSGQLGDGTTTGKTSPVNVTGLSNGVVAIAAGGYHTCALKSSGGVKCWGHNSYGQLGDGSLSQLSTTPVDVVVSLGGAALDGVVSIGGGYLHSCALTSSGGVKCWGYNAEGEVGDGTTINRYTLTDVSGLSGGVAKIFVGWFNSCAVTTAGAAKCWGLNDNRQLGDGTTINRTAPVDVSGLGSGVASITNGYLHACALLTSGGMKCWGSNGYGQLGDGTTTARPTPVDVSGLTSGVATLGAGSFVSCAALNAGGVKCWGAGDNGRLGNGGTAHLSTPTDVTGVKAAFLASATLTTSALTAGSHTITATYNGDSNHSGSNNTVAQDVIGPPVVSSLSPTAGPVAGGTVVTITGTNLSGASAVSFGATNVTTFTVNSATQITATAPAGTGTVDVVVTTPAGASATSAADQFTYVPLPGVSAIAPTAGPASGGTSVIISGINLSGATAVSFGANAATGFTVDSATQITATAPAGAGTVDVRVTTVGGTSATSAADQFTYVPAPTVTALSPTAGPVAGGTSVVISGTNLSGASAVSFGANAATGFTVTSATSITATAPAGTGTVDVRVTTLGGASATSAADQFTYVAMPTLASVAPSSGATVGGTSVVITGTNLSGASAVTFDGIAAQSFMVDSATQITAMTPPHAVGAVDVAVTTVGGTVTSSGAYTYQLSPTTTTVSTSKTPTFLGEAVTFTARVGASGGGLPTGNVSFSSSIDGSLGPAALSAAGGSTIGGGVEHTCAVTATGGVKCWGYNGYGQLGSSTGLGVDDPVPVPVDVTGLSGVVAIAAGDYHTCALLNAGTVKCWGYNYVGQLGNGTGTGTTTPQPPLDVTGLTGVVAIAAGGYHTCALMGGGEVKCWGYNGYGQLGNATGTGSANPYPVPADVAGLSGVVAITAAQYHTCALLGTGAVKCWGINRYGQLGNGANSGSMSANPTPLDVTGLSGAVVITAGQYHTCTLMTGGGVKCWGNNYHGQLGSTVDNLSDTAHPTPTDVAGLTTVAAIAAGGYHTCALLSGGAMKCWGGNFPGQLGNSTNHNTEFATPAPVDVVGLSGVAAIAAGGRHTCAILGGNEVSCWGRNRYGQLGSDTNLGSNGGVVTPATVAGLSAALFAKATLTTSALTAGSHTITATYNGDSNHSGSNNTIGQDVIGAPTVTVLSPTVGPLAGGTVVTITGTNFTGVSAVTFGGSAATAFTVDSATQITATSPAHSAGTVDVVVTTPAGASATGSADQFAYIGAPTLASVSPNAGPTAGGASVTITGTSLATTSAVTFDGVAAASFTVDSDTQITAVTPAHATGSVDVAVTTVGGTATSTSAYTYVVAPTLASVSPTSGPATGGTAVTLTGTNLTGASAVTFGGVAATSVNVVSATTVTATTPAHAAGAVDVAVTTAGGTATLAGGFTYTNGSLQVSGTGNMIALGPQGGPFNPASFSYLLKSSAGPLNWQLSGVPDWLTVSPGTSGSTDATGITVTFTTNTNATTKAVGTYGLSTIAFTNTDNGQGNTTRSAGLTVSPRACEVVARGPEFNGDGKGDILWRSDTGAIGMWFMNGTALSSGPGLGTVATDWRLIGAADFNGDGKSDLLWRNRTSGQVAVWFISGVTVTGTVGLGTVGADWQIVGAADFDGDHVADILWRHDTGTLALWHGTGGTGQGRAVIGSVDMSWRIAGLGDFDGDGKSDILWRSTSGVVAVWLMNGDLTKGSASFGAVPPDWRIAGVGDFNGDGKADILWRQDAGVVAMWFMNGGAIASSGGVGTIAADWHIAGTNDYNGDGKADLLWRQDNGSLGVWLMNGASVTSSGGVSGVGYDWHVVNGEHDRPVVLIQPGPC